MELHEKLQQLRKEKGWTQEELAEMLYVSRTAISKWESGRGYPSIDSLKAISKLFKVSIDDLLSGEELISIAETEQKEKTQNMRDLVFGVLDCMAAILFILPVFAVIFGVIEVILHKYQRIYWNQGKLFASLGFSVLGTMIFMISQQPYAGFFLLCMLVIKGILALKQR